MRDITGLVRKATSQHGLLTIADLRAAGCTPAAQRTLQRRGVLVPARRGVLRLAGSHDSFEQRLLTVVFASGGRAVASHLSALRLHGLHPQSSRIEVTVPYPADCRLDGVAVHRSRTLDDAQVTTLDGIPVTRCARTLLDVADRLPGRLLGPVVDHAVAVGLVDLDELRSLRRTVGGRGVRRLDAVLGERIGASGGESGPELDLARLLRSAGLPKPEPQFELTLDGCRYRIDLAYPAGRLAIEYDGYDAHSGPGRFEDDRRRQNHLVRAGWRVLRFTARDLREDRAGVVALVRAELDRPPTRASA